MRSSGRPAIATAAAMVAGSLAWIGGIWASGLEGAPGFFGPGPLIADANLILEVFLVAGVSYGFALARRGNINAHQINQTTWVALNLGLIVLVMAGSMQDVRIAKTADLDRVAKAGGRVWRITIQRGGQQISAVFSG